MSRPSDPVRDVEEARCCVVGGGPAGVMLGYLLARQGVPVLLLEAHKDFDREFRGDTLHPSVMEILDDLGLAERLLELPHSKIRSGMFRTPGGPLSLANFSGLRTRYPYITLIRQDQFLDFLAAEAARYPTFRRRMGANVKELVEGEGTVRGVRYQTHDGWHEVRADLTVACDGRFSRLRELAGLEPARTSSSIDVLWFRLPHVEGDAGEEQVTGSIRGGHMLIRFDRRDYWQLGYVIPKGGYHDLRAAGMDRFRGSIVELMPELADRVDHLRQWKQVSPLSIESSCLARWYKPGLLLIGDAAHVMSPVGGVGINYAIQDAAAASNLLAVPLREGRLRVEDLAAVQRLRRWPTKIIQAFQAFLQDGLISRAIAADRPFRPPLLMRLPLFRKFFSRFLAFGVWPVRVRLHEEIAPAGRGP
jgi:2-polyprenyl-6-methoxyphenol hydroxylase-like FAD-dependent oxidoreductase